MSLIGNANAHSPDRTVALGILGIRPLRYRGEGVSAGSAVSGLRVRSTASDETPLFHESTGIYGFLRLKPGPHRIHVTDPAGRFLPAAIEVELPPERHEVRSHLERGLVPPDGLPDAAIRDVRLRPSIGQLPVAGEAGLWGQVLAGGRGVPFARLEIETVLNNAPGTMVTHTDLQGVFLARLPGEHAEISVPAPGVDGVAPGDGEEGDHGFFRFFRTDREEELDEPEVASEFQRELREVRPLKPEYERRIRLANPLLGLPTNFDEIDLSAGDTPYAAPATFTLWPGGKEPSGGSVPKFVIKIGRRERWDVVLS